MPAEFETTSLVSDGVRAALIRFLGRILGLVIIGLALLLAVALLSGSFSDPSSQTSATGDIKNWLGAPGAEIAARLYSVFYLSAPLLALSPFIWGLSLVRGKRIPRWRLRLISLPFVVFIIGLGVSGLLKTGGDGGGGFVALAMMHIMNMIGPIPDLLGIEAARFVGFGIMLGGLLAYIYVSALRVKHLQFLSLGLALAGRAATKLVRIPARLLWLPVSVLINRRTAANSNSPETDMDVVEQASDAVVPRKSKAKTKPAAKSKERVEPTLFSDLDNTSPEAPKTPAKTTSQKRAKPKQNHFEFDPASGFQLPPHDLLHPPLAKKTGPSQDELQDNAKRLESVLGDYRVEGEITDIQSGPVVTRYDLVPAPGIKSQRVISLADDVARSMAAMAVRVAVVPGQNVIGIELPNDMRETVMLRDILDTEIWDGHKGDLPIALGKDIAGAPVVADLARMPHLLVAGTTGSGKSVGINGMILSLLYRHTPETCRLIMIDPKMLELSVYDGIPHLLTPVVTDPGKAVMALKWAVQEMDSRYRNMSKVGVRNISGYNQKLQEALAKGEVLSRRVQTGFDPETGKPVFEEEVLDMAPLPFIVVIIDEVADLMMVAGKEIDIAVQRLAQKARAAGIHVIMATQRPSVDVITGTIKSNFPTRISFQVASKIDSRTILNEQGAEQLLGRGDMLFVEGGGRLKRVHGPFMDDEEVETVANFLRAQGEPDYDEQVTEEPEDDGFGESGGGGAMSATGNSLYDQAVALVAREQRASTSFVQRHLKIGYNRAATLIEEMESAGIIGKANHVGKREVLIDRNES